MMTNDSVGIDISKDFLDAHRQLDRAAARFPDDLRKVPRRPEEPNLAFPKRSWWTHPCLRAAIWRMSVHRP